MTRSRVNRLARSLMLGTAFLAPVSGFAAMTRADLRSGDTAIVFASWYGPAFHGRRTASGQVFDQERLTAAHKTLPFGTKLKVTNLRNGRSVFVTVNDRGPYAGNRQLDVSLGAARRLGLVRRGTAPVLIEQL